MTQQPQNPETYCRTQKQRKMSSAFMKSLPISRVVIQRPEHLVVVAKFSRSVKLPTFCKQTKSYRPYFRLPDYLRETRKYDVSPSKISPSSFASAAIASLSKIGFVGWYLGMVRSRPILTKSLTSALIHIAADFSSQIISMQSSVSYDFERTIRMAGYGMLIIGPSLHYWFNFMSKLFPERDLFSTLKKVFLGQAVYGTTITVVFFSLNAYLQGETSTEIVARLKRDLLPAMLSGITYWPACDFITYRFIPLHLQPLVSNIFTYIWTVYMTYMASLEKAVAAS